MRAVLIDFVDTLAERWPRRETLLADVLEAVAHVRPARGRIRAVYRMLDEVYPYSSVRLRTRGDRQTYYQDYNQKLLGMLGLPQELAQSVHAAFLDTPRPWRLKDGALALLRQIAEGGRPLAVVSNFDAGLERLLTDELAVPSAYLPVVLASQECGVEKPDSRFFKQALDKLQVAAEQSVHIGDSVSLDYLPARALGIRALLLDEDGDYAHLPDTVNSLGMAADRLGTECC